MTDRRHEKSLTTIDVVEPHVRRRGSGIKCLIGSDIKFNTADLESYVFAAHEPTVYDALLVSAAVEFADRFVARSQMTWQRQILLKVPVHNVARWKSPSVSGALHDALDFLTGDRWLIEFYPASAKVEHRQGNLFDLPSGVTAVMPFSDGLDSRAVAGLMSLQMKDELLRVRLGTKDYDEKIKSRPFQAVPYKVSAVNGRFVESTARSRGFKFAIISGIAAHLAKASRIVVSESGQGSIGPALVTVGQAYSDYRNHPLYLEKVEHLLKALFGHEVTFQYPRIWNTKAETLREFAEKCEDGHSWQKTKSCWQQNRQSSVEGKWRHCGICAACILRRLSVHAASLSEPKNTYIWENLQASSFHDGASTSFERKKITRKMKEYAIAGVLHLDHLAGLRSSHVNEPMLNLTAFKLSRCLKLPSIDVREKMDRLLATHEVEWRQYVSSLEKKSFVAKWAVEKQ